MALAIADSNGIKRICTNCGTRYYDMGKTPVTCPSCDTEFVGQVKPKAVESLDEKKKEEETEVVDITAGAKSEGDDAEEAEEVISLDDVDEDFDDGDDDMSLDDSDLDLDEISAKSDDE